MVTQTHAEIEFLRRKLWYLSLGLSDSRRKGATRSTLNPDFIALYLAFSMSLKPCVRGNLGTLQMYCILSSFAAASPEDLCADAFTYWQNDC
ncbi:hypothetical protein DPMN_056154 [Dreissena polymorpha]|uniref:Uncharacterized protein n=1 Tax=Dreissena polymorpha TaxID=45954 RepID=A0A9D4CR71_DREPO|nr:hypothetical protein DPMN_056154 [Dreissena polymorpha]